MRLTAQIAREAKAMAEGSLKSHPQRLRRVKAATTSSVGCPVRPCDPIFYQPSWPIACLMERAYVSS
jgi:hypothetical protein